MYLTSLEISGFKSFAKKDALRFTSPISAIVGPNGSGKSNIAEAFRFVLGEQSIKSLRGKKGEDLIFNGAGEGGRANRAGVKVTFDNTKRMLNIDFDEVVIERVVHRDGVNEYLINGSAVRLKDIIELLAGAHIGASGHHIISQGEADKMLNASIRDRRIMIEDALGLKLYQYKKEESLRKLEKTRENIKDVESLRRELAPHIKFLKKQVEKIERALALKLELVTLSKEYLRREDAYITREKGVIADEKEAPHRELAELAKELEILKKTIAETAASTQGSRSPELIVLEQQIQKVRGAKDEATRELGRIEGEISYLKRSIAKRNDDRARESNRTVYLREVENLSEDVSEKLAEIEKGIGEGQDAGTLRGLVARVRQLVTDFITHHREQDVVSAEDQEFESDLEKLNQERGEIEAKIVSIKNEEQAAAKNYEVIKQEIERGKDKNVEAEKAILKIMGRQSELYAIVQTLKSREEKVKVEEEDFKRELEETVMLAGREAINYERVDLSDQNQTEVIFNEERGLQVERRRALEKIKIRLEEAGVGSTDEVMKEYTEAEERDAFLTRELGDLIHSASSLEDLIKELVEKLDTEFRTGVAKINDQFNNFFNLMFGGGHASLSVVKEKKRARRNSRAIGSEDQDDPDNPDLSGEDEDLLENISNSEEEEETEEGVDIEVSLPRKKIKGLVMLSGGERALTSIALLFAISQVNPPPFIILDETDAALDEANSRKYGDMIENLAKYSQLILITHNRETMSRAGSIFGVTMGKEGASKLLSIAFDEAVAVAK
ncbi:MAG: AAA family ATPase [Candidatus Pacebacteria bacterium]|nr:AAA family ATPase [Candidatus Paceibacterota bacterium]